MEPVWLNQNHTPSGWKLTQYKLLTPFDTIYSVDDEDLIYFRCSTNQPSKSNKTPRDRPYLPLHCRYAGDEGWSKFLKLLYDQGGNWISESNMPNEETNTNS
jgi:hypothetical protein